MDEPFHPPYILAGHLLLAIGLLDHEPPLPTDRRLNGYRPVRLGSRPLGLLIASDFTDPPTEMPVSYREVIVAVLLRRGVRLAALPVSMQLDAELPVDYGRRHYGMPKRLDRTLEVLAGRGELRLRGEALSVDGHGVGVVGRALLTPISIASALGVRLVTSVVPVVGMGTAPARRAIVALWPSGIGRPMRVERATVPVGELRVWWAQRFEVCRTWLGPPSAWRGETDG